MTGSFSPFIVFMICRPEPGDTDVLRSGEHLVRGAVQGGLWRQAHLRRQRPELPGWSTSQLLFTLVAFLILNNGLRCKPRLTRTPGPAQRPGATSPTRTVAATSTSARTTSPTTSYVPQVDYTYQIDHCYPNNFIEKYDHSPDTIVNHQFNSSW